jgi:uncharacterized membrane protein HdeD (DUF308 family)
MAGIGLLAWPHETVHVVALVFASALLAASFVRYLAAFTGPEGGLDRPLHLVVLANVGVIVGIYLLLNWTISLMALMIVASIYLLVNGVIELIRIERSGHWMDRAWLLASGTVALIVALVLTTSLVAPSTTPVPHQSLELLCRLLGSWLIFYGLLLILRGALGLASALRQS